MQSKKYSCNTTILYKNITRFAPVWGLYTLCLILGIFLVYSNGGTMKEYHYAANIAQLGQIMAIVNLMYAPIVAQLLFGDLYNSRMCYALHAMPVRRENLLVTNAVSGLLFSLVPTLVMTGFASVLMQGTIFVDAYLLPLYAFAAANLQFVFFFGLSVFCVMCTGNRLGMALVYGVINFGSQIAFWLVDTVYTPMLYGVITPTQLKDNLTPVSTFTNHPLIECDTFSDVRTLFEKNWEDAVAHYTITEHWTTLFIWTGVGILFLLLAMVLYRKRSLECAGDALAFKVLNPLFQVVFSVVSAFFAYSFVSVFIGYYTESSTLEYLLLGVGLVVGWFACQMMIERSTRVFRFRNWLKLAGLTAVLVLSMVLTHFDVFGIATWQPKLEDIESICFGGRYSSDLELTEEEDFRKVLLLQQEALEERLTQDGPYVLAADGSYIYNIDTNAPEIARSQWEIDDCRFVFRARIEYILKSGKHVNRQCWVWADGESADYARDMLSRWDECINRPSEDGIDHLAEILEELNQIYIGGSALPVYIKDPDKAFVEGLLEAIRKDCAEHNMAQNYTLHTGYFQEKAADEYGNKYKTHSIYVNFDGVRYGWSIEIFPDSSHTVKYLQDNDLLHYDIFENNLHFN